MFNVIKCGSCNDHRVIDGKRVYQIIRMLFICYIFVVTIANDSTQHTAKKSNT